MYFRNFTYHQLWLILFILLSSCSTTLLDRTPIFLSLNEAKRTRFSINPSEKNSKKIRWFYKSPIPLDYDNTKNCSKKFQCITPLKYKTKELRPLKGKASFLLSELHLNNNLGTHHLIYQIDNQKKEVQLVIRRGNSYPNILTELIGVPFVYAPTIDKKGFHQTDQRLGADCIALVIYGKRRMGMNIPYFAPPKIYELTDKIGNSFELEKLNIKEGDILHFGFQTAVISIDKEPKGKLSKNDIIIHTFHALAKEVTFSKLPYKNHNFEILRWK